MGEFVPEGADDRTDLVGNDDLVIELLRRVDLVLILDLPAALTGHAFPFLDKLLGNDFRTIFRDLGLDGVNFVPNIHAIRNSFLVTVVADDVVVEIAVSSVVRSGSEAYLESIEVIEDLLPEIVNRAVALIDDEEVEDDDDGLIAFEFKVKALKESCNCIKLF